MSEEERDEQDVYREDEEEEENEMPLHYYRRLNCKVMSDGRASALFAHSKMLFVGMESGWIHLLDWAGRHHHSVKAHSCKVMDVNVDDSAEYMASVGQDGSLFLFNVFQKKFIERVSYKSTMLYVRFEPQYHKSSRKAIAIGGTAGSVIVRSKGRFLGYGEKVLHHAKDRIYGLEWKHKIIASAISVGIRLYDDETLQPLHIIKKPLRTTTPVSFKVVMKWKDSEVLLVGWADRIMVYRMLHGQTPDAPMSGVEVLSEFKTDHLVCGLSLYQEYILSLAFIDEEHVEGYSDSETQLLPIAGDDDMQFQGREPEVRVLTFENEEVALDAIEITNYKSLSPLDYSLCGSTDDGNIFVFSPYDIIYGKPLSVDDQINWLLNPARRRYEEALELIRSSGSGMKHRESDVGEAYLAYLLKEKDYDGVHRVCKGILGEDAKRWRSLVYQLAQMDELQCVSDIIPTSNPRLDKKTYGMILGGFVRNDHAKFLETIQRWPPEVYDMESVIDLVNSSMSTYQGVELMDALALLYLYDGQYEKTLHIYLRLKRTQTFELIRRHNLFGSIRDNIVLLLETDLPHALLLLTEHTDRVPIAMVVRQLTDHPKLLHSYLDALFRKDPNMSKEYHDLQVSLYATYDVNRLLPFMKESAHLDLDKAAKFCEEKGLYQELAFIQGKVGNNRLALDTLMQKIGNVKPAIAFVEAQDDKELWQYLIDHSMRSAKFVGGLLDNIGASEYVDPIELIRKIPNKLEIHRLRDRLVKIIYDYNLQMSLREGCNIILKDDCWDLFERLVTEQRRAMIVKSQEVCPVCQAKVGNPTEADSGLIVFFCHHIYHESCLKQASQALVNRAEEDVGYHEPASGFAAPLPSQIVKQRETVQYYCVICKGGASQE